MFILLKYFAWEDGITIWPNREIPLNSPKNAFKILGSGAKN